MTKFLERMATETDFIKELTAHARRQAEHHRQAKTILTGPLRAPEHHGGAQMAWEQVLLLLPENDKEKPNPVTAIRDYIASLIGTSAEYIGDGAEALAGVMHFIDENFGEAAGEDDNA